MTNQSNSSCPGYEGCKAPLCPLDESITEARWYSDEVICNNLAMRRQHRWIRVQRRIVKKCGKAGDTYFTMKMLEATRAVHKSLKGVDPDSHIRNTPDNPTGDPVDAWILARGTKLSGISALKEKTKGEGIPLSIPGAGNPVSQIPMFR